MLYKLLADLELIYKVGNEYVSEFGSDLPDKFNRVRAFDRVVSRGDYVYMVLNSEAKETKLISQVFYNPIGSIFINYFWYKLKT